MQTQQCIPVASFRRKDGKFYFGYRECNDPNLKICDTQDNTKPTTYEECFQECKAHLDDIGGLYIGGGFYPVPVNALRMAADAPYLNTPTCTIDWMLNMFEYVFLIRYAEHIISIGDTFLFNRAQDTQFHPWPRHLDHLLQGCGEQYAGGDDVGVDFYSALREGQFVTGYVNVEEAQTAAGSLVDVCVSLLECGNVLSYALFNRHPCNITSNPRQDIVLTRDSIERLLGAWQVIEHKSSCRDSVCRIDTTSFKNMRFVIQQLHKQFQMVYGQSVVDPIDINDTVLVEPDIDDLFVLIDVMKISYPKNDTKTTEVEIKLAPRPLLFSSPYAKTLNFTVLVPDRWVLCIEKTTKDSAPTMALKNSGLSVNAIKMSAKFFDTVKIFIEYSEITGIF